MCSSDLRQVGVYSGITDDRYKWPTNIDFQISTAFCKSPADHLLHYLTYDCTLIDASAAQPERDTIISALRTLAGILSNCRAIRLPGTPTGDHVFITNQQNGCFSSVGRRGGRQNLNLGAGCVRHDIAVHEMIHAIGFHHEQIRPDRDQYVNIFWGNIRPGKKDKNFY